MSLRLCLLLIAATTGSGQGPTTIYIAAILDTEGVFVFDNVSGEVLTVGIYDSNGNPISSTLAPQTFNALAVKLPQDWAIFSNPATGSKATVSRAAVPTKVHVCTGFSFAYSATTAVAAAGLNVAIRDGATGVGTVLWQFGILLPAAVIPNFIFGLAGLHMVGSNNTAMTIEFSGALANLVESVNLSGYDE